MGCQGLSLQQQCLEASEELKASCEAIGTYGGLLLPLLSSPFLPPTESDRSRTKPCQHKRWRTESALTTDGTNVMDASQALSSVAPHKSVAKLCQLRMLHRTRLSASLMSGFATPKLYGQKKKKNSECACPRLNFQPVELVSVQLMEMNVSP